MEAFTDAIVAALAAETGLPLEDLRLESPRNPDLGDFAFPCFPLAKALRKAPPAIAAELAPQLAERLEGISVEATGPYLNFRVDRALLARTLVGAVLAALRLAERTGEAQVVETSLYETAVWTQASDYAITAMDRAPLRPRAREQMIIPTANRYPCGDGKWIVLNMPEEAAWPRLCRVIGREDWLGDERLQDIRGRFQNMPELVRGIDEALAHRTRDEWGEIFDAEGMIWGPVLGLHEVASDAQAEAIGLFPEIKSEQIGTYRSVGVPMRFATADVGPQGPAPAVGQHTRQILLDAGFDAAEIDALVERGSIGGT